MGQKRKRPRNGACGDAGDCRSPLHWVRALGWVVDPLPGRPIADALVLRGLGAGPGLGVVKPPGLDFFGDVVEGRAPRAGVVKMFTVHTLQRRHHDLPLMVLMAASKACGSAPVIQTWARKPSSAS